MPVTLYKIYITPKKQCNKGAKPTLLIDVADVNRQICHSHQKQPGRRHCSGRWSARRANLLIMPTETGGTPHQNPRMHLCRELYEGIFIYYCYLKDKW